MNPTQSDRVARDEAIEWWVRLDGDDLSAAERRRFEAWLSNSAENHDAFVDICALWGELDSLKPIIRKSQAVGGGSRAHGRGGRSQQRIWALAAGVVAAVVALWLAIPGADFRAPAGENRTVRLADGSTVVLASGSAMNMRYSKGRRELDLVEGEAWFEVQPDAARPFVVRAGTGTATALGTAFDVRKREDRVEVAVLESRVAVDSGMRSSGSPVIVAAGQRIVYSATSAPSAATTADVDSLTAWRRGRLVFEAQPLGQVVEDLNRFRRGIIVITDDQLKRRVVSGVFTLDRDADVAAALEQTLAVKTTRITNYLVFLRAG
jgi:transmembrane sensor